MCRRHTCRFISYASYTCLHGGSIIHYFVFITRNRVTISIKNRSKKRRCIHVSVFRHYSGQYLAPSTFSEHFPLKYKQPSATLAAVDFTPFNRKDSLQSITPHFARNGNPPLIASHERKQAANLLHQPSTTKMKTKKFTLLWIYC